MSLRRASDCHYHSKVHGKLKFSLKIIQASALLVSLTCAIAAQEKTDTNQAPFSSTAYRIGERLTYDVSFAQFVSAAHVELLVAARGKFFGREGIQLRAHVETTGVVNAALLSLNNDYTTYVYPETGLPYRAQQVVREAGRTTEASVDYNQPAGTDALPPKLRLGEFPGIYDLLSSLYRVRSMPLATGTSFLIPVRDQGNEYQAEIRVTGKQLIKTNVGSFDAIATRVITKSGPDYNIRVYFSDDEWHVPVLITAKHKSGEIRAELAGSALPARTTSINAPRTIVDPPIKTPPQNVIPTVPARTTPAGSKATTKDTPLAPLDLPFKIGEQLNYQVFLGTGNQAVGSINFTLRARGRYFNRDGLQFVGIAQTSDSKILSVRDQIISYVDPVTLLPFRTEVSFSEGKYRTVRNYNLDQDRGSAILESNREELFIPVGTYDLISAIYAIRTFELSIQRQSAISLMAVNRPRALIVKVQRRETIELNGQKIPALMLILTTDDPQPDKMQVRMWVGDDARHLPLRITAVTDLGPVRADLTVVPAISQ